MIEKHLLCGIATIRLDTGSIKDFLRIMKKEERKDY